MATATEAVTTVTDATFASQYASYFDVKLLFEHAILTILPTALIISACPFHLNRYRRKQANISRSSLFWTKLMTAVLLIALEVTKSIVAKFHPDYFTPAAAAATSLSCVAAFCIALMLILEDRHASQSSVLLSIYLPLVVIADSIKARALLMRPGLHFLAVLSVTTAILKFLLMILQELPKDVSVPDSKSKQKYNQEAIGGFWTRTLALWVNPVLVLGFRNSLELHHLAYLGPDFAARLISDHFAPYWQKASQYSQYSLLRASNRALFWLFMYPAIPRLCLTGLTLLTPLLMRRILIFVNDLAQQDPSKHPPYIKIGLILSFATVYVGIAIAKASNLHLSNRYSISLRGLLVSQILKKNLRLPLKQARDSAALTLISNDVESILLNIGQFHSVWISFIEFGLTVYFLYQNIGAACFLPIITITSSIVLSHIVTKQTVAATENLNDTIETRVSDTTSIFQNIKALKMIGIEPTITKTLQGLRNEEIEKSLVVRKMEVNKISLLPLVFAFTPLVTVAGTLWASFAYGLDATSVFVMMAYLFLIYGPLSVLINCWPTLGSVAACFKRIQDFLKQEEHVDPRVIVDFADPNESSDKAKASGPRTRVRTTSGSQADGEKMQPRTSSGSTNSDGSPRPCVVLANATIGCREPPVVILHRVNFDILCGSFVMVIGPTASGKSTLLKTILGEMDVLGGEVRYNGNNMAYADQKAWLPNVTVRATILGESEFDTTWYTTVVRACALEDDIKRLGHGDQSLVGTNGAALSGGQKLRLSLARAVYSRAPILVLDDILSALDAPTASHIVTELFSPTGLLKAQRRTTILATHAVDYRITADQVLELSAEGSVKSETGEARLHELTFTPPQYKDIVKNAKQNIPVPLEVVQLEADMAVSSAQVKRGGDFRLYSFFLQFVPKSHLWRFFCLISFVGLLERSPQVFLRIWVDYAPQNKQWLIGLAVIAVAAVFANRYTAKAYMIGIIPIISESMHEMFVHSVVGATLPYLTATGTGSLINRASQDMTVLGHDLPTAFYRVTYISAIVVADTGIILAGATYAWLMIPIIFFVLYVIQLFYLRTSRQMRHLDLETKTPLFTQVSETCLGLEHIRSFGWTDSTLDKSLRLLDDSQRPYYYLLSLQRWLGLVLDMSTASVGTVIVAIAVHWPGTTTEPSLALSLLSTFAYSLALMALVERWTLLETALGAVARLRDFVNTTPIEKDAPGAVAKPKGWPFTGEIQFKDVSCQYKHAKRAHNALENIDVTMKAGSKVVIKGRTGSGKSSFMLALLNFFEHEGQILIDGVDITTVPRSQLRKMISTIPQDTPELPGTVRQNLLPWDVLKPAGEQGKLHEEMVVAILDSVDLWGHIHWYGGLDAPYKDMEFSSGQKQLFSLCRAMLHKLEYETTIVLMDEWTSNLDDESELLAQNAMDVAFGDCTRLIISHSEISYDECDLYLEFGNGQLIHEVDVAKWRVDDEISRRIAQERANAGGGAGQGNGDASTDNAAEDVVEDAVGDPGGHSSEQSIADNVTYAASGETQ